MATGKVQVNNLNLGQGAATEIERHLLFIGRAGSAEEESQLFSVNASSDLETLLADSSLRDQVIAAQLNAGQNWTAAVYPLADGETVFDAIDHANEVQSFEGVAVCDVQTTQEQITAIYDKVFSMPASAGRWNFALIAVPGIDPAAQTWPQYEAAMVTLQDGIKAELVSLTPQLNGNNVGVVAGRLSDRSVSVADSPMRVATGGVKGLGSMPVDSTGTPLSMATLETLATNRFSVPQWYNDYDGIYWADCAMLDAEGGDYQVIENVRVVHKASRRIRLLAIQRIANRVLNSTPNSIELNKAYFMKPLRDMSKSTTINGIVFPGEVEPPQADDIEITWTSKTAVVISITIRPYNSPKSITVNIALDLSAE
ncbi:DUF2586 domain-containing protein [Shewanella sp.]|uniref:DUF2586 domain-containing protein n=1 Tax=Shewanella sp. TaxID=50422 RepID=UPI003A9791FE